MKAYLTLFTLILLSLTANAAEIPVRGVLLSGDELIGEVRLTKNSQNNLTLIIDESKDGSAMDSIMETYELTDYTVSDTVRKLKLKVFRIIHMNNGIVTSYDKETEVKIKKKNTKFLFRLSLDRSDEHFEKLNDFEKMDGFSVYYVCSTNGFEYDKKSWCERACTGDCKKNQRYTR